MLEQFDHRRLRARVAGMAERAGDADARGGPALTGLVERPQLCQQRLDRPRLAEALDHALGGEPALGQGAHEHGHGIRVVREREPGDGHEPHVGIVVVEHRLQPGHALGQAQVGEDQHGAAARGPGTGTELGLQAGGQP